MLKSDNLHLKLILGIWNAEEGVVVIQDDVRQQKLFFSELAQHLWFSWAGIGKVFLLQGLLKLDIAHSVSVQL